MSESADQTVDLSGRVRRGLTWSVVNNVIVRLGSMGVTIVLARLLAPKDFGIFAVALTVQAIVMAFADLGISADLIRHGDIRRRGPTVATIALVTTSAMCVAMCLLAGPTSALLGSSDAAPVVRVMSLTLILSGLGVVPYAHLQREFLQGRQFAADASSMVIGSAVTLVLVGLGMGAMSLALGRIAGQSVTTVLQFRFAKMLPALGWNGTVARAAVGFGLPIAGANLLSWIVMNVDNMMVGHHLGAVMLGLYVMAFNVSSWPMTLVGQSIRNVSLPGFARYKDDPHQAGHALATTASLVWAIAMPMGIGLVLLASPVIRLLYGAKWDGSAAPLMGLGAFGALRVMFDFLASFLYAHGRSGDVLWVQAMWLMSLIPAMYLGIHGWSLSGAGWAHVVIGAAVILPGYLWALRRAGFRAFSALTGASRCLVACAFAGAALVTVRSQLDSPLLEVVTAGVAFAIVYSAIMLPWALKLRARGRAAGSLSGLEREVVS